MELEYIHAQNGLKLVFGSMVKEFVGKPIKENLKRIASISDYIKYREKIVNVYKD